MYSDGIKSGVNLGHKNEVISRKIYITYPTYAFEGNYELEFELFDAIGNEFKIPISSIQVAGSSKTGYSYFQSKEFIRGKSDLDIAIISEDLFRYYCEIVLRKTKGFKDLTNFHRDDEKNDYTFYIKNISRGFFRPDLMPSCDEKRDWFNFFNKLSQKYTDIFRDINAGIYFSQTFFEFKQANNIDLFKRLSL